MDILEMLERSLDDTKQALQYDLFVEEFYCNGSIKKFIKEFNKLGTDESATTNTINGREPDEYENKIIDMAGKSHILSKMFATKKLMSKPKDFEKLAEALNIMADQCMKISQMKNKKGKN